MTSLFGPINCSNCVNKAIDMASREREDSSILDSFELIGVDGRTVGYVGSKYKSSDIHVAAVSDVEVKAELLRLQREVDSLIKERLEADELNRAQLKAYEEDFLKEREDRSSVVKLNVALKEEMKMVQAELRKLCSQYAPEGTRNPNNEHTGAGAECIASKEMVAMVENALRDSKALALRERELMSAREKMAALEMELKEMRVELAATRADLEAAKEEIAVKVAQVKQYQKQVEAYKGEAADASETLVIEVNNSCGVQPPTDHLHVDEHIPQPVLVPRPPPCEHDVPPHVLEPTLPHNPTLLASPHAASGDVVQMPSAAQAHVHSAVCEPSYSKPSNCDHDGGSSHYHDDDGDLPPPIYHASSPQTLYPPVAGLKEPPQLEADPNMRVPPGYATMPQAGGNRPHFLPVRDAACIGAGVLMDTDSRGLEETCSPAPLDPNLRCPACGRYFKKGRIQEFRQHVLMCGR